MSNVTITMVCNRKRQALWDIYTCIPVHYMSILTWVGWERWSRLTKGSTGRLRKGSTHRVLPFMRWSTLSHISSTRLNWGSICWCCIKEMRADSTDVHNTHVTLLSYSSIQIYQPTIITIQLPHPWTSTEPFLNNMEANILIIILYTLTIHLCFKTRYNTCVSSI